MTDINKIINDMDLKGHPSNHRIVVAIHVVLTESFRLKILSFSITILVLLLLVLRSPK